LCFHHRQYHCVLALLLVVIYLKKTKSCIPHCDYEQTIVRNCVFEIHVVAYLVFWTARFFFILDGRGREVLMNQPYRSLIYGFWLFLWHLQPFLSSFD
jgi:hypothetical protein